MQYFCPGIIFIMIIRTFGFKKFAEKYTVIISCVISYLFVSLVGTANDLLFHIQALRKPLVVSGISMLVSLILGILLSLVFKSETFKKMTLKCFHKTLYDDIWQDVFDFKNGTNLKVYMRDKTYYVVGHYKYNEEKGDDSWMALSAYGMFDKANNKPVGLSYVDNENVIITLRMRDIEHIEVF